MKDNSTAQLVAHAREMRTSLNDELPNGVGNTIDALCDALTRVQPSSGDRGAQQADGLSSTTEPVSRLGPTGFDPARKDEYIGRYLREFDRQFAAYPSVDLRSVLQAADSHFEQQTGGEPELDAKEEADCWREAS